MHGLVAALRIAKDDQLLALTAAILLRRVQQSLERSAQTLMQHHGKGPELPNEEQHRKHGAAEESYERAVAGLNRHGVGIVRSADGVIEEPLVERSCDRADILNTFSRLHIALETFGHHEGQQCASRWDDKKECHDQDQGKLHPRREFDVGNVFVMKGGEKIFVGKRDCQRQGTDG